LASRTLLLIISLMSVSTLAKTRTHSKKHPRKHSATSTNTGTSTGTQDNIGVTKVIDSNANTKANDDSASANSNVGANVVATVSRVPLRSKRTCELVDGKSPFVKCSDDAIYEFDEYRTAFKRGAVAATCSYRTVDQSQEDFHHELKNKDLLHFALGETMDCFELTSIRERGKSEPVSKPLASSERHPVVPKKPEIAGLPTCPPGSFWIDGRCTKAQEHKFHSDQKIAKLIKRIAHKFYRSANFNCPGKEEFVALSGLNVTLTGYPIPGAGQGISIAPLVAPADVDVSARGVDPRLPVTCGYNNDTGDTFRVSFFCRDTGTCYQQGDVSLPHDCKEFKPSSKDIGSQRWAYGGMDCSDSRRYRNGGEEGDFVLRELGPGVYIKIVQDNWDDVFYHGLIFSKDPTVVEFWQSEDAEE
jgi:hypothetical protein